MNDTDTKQNLSELCTKLTDRLNAKQFGKSDRGQLTDLHQTLGMALDIAENHRRKAMRWLGVGTVILGVLLLALVGFIVFFTWCHKELGAVLLSVLALCIAVMLFAVVRVLHQVIDQP